MNPKDWIDLLQRLFAWFSERRNPVRQQAARVLATFEAMGWPVLRSMLCCRRRYSFRLTSGPVPISSSWPCVRHI